MAWRCRVREAAETASEKTLYAQRVFSENAGILFRLIPPPSSGYKTLMGKLKVYLLATRPQFLPASIIPVLLGAAAAHSAAGSFRFPFLLASLMAAALYHSGMNVLNDYFDYLNGTDNINKGALTPFTGGSRFIQRGVLTPRATLFLGIVLVLLGSVLGVYLAWKTTWLLLLIGGAGLLSGFFYSAPPIFLAGRGLGELTVGINFGLLTVIGSYLVQAGTFGIEAVFASLPLSFLIAALLYINGFPDLEADRASGKRTLVVRLGPERGRYWLAVFVFGAYASVVAGVTIGALPRYSLISLLSLFFALKGLSGLLKNYMNGPLLIPSIKNIILAHFTAGLLLIISFLL